MVWLDIMDVKALPNSSPMEGGGHMALVFYQPLPQGIKMVYFVSTTTHPQYYQIEQATDENAYTLSCPIPKYPIAEEVELRVIYDQQVIASTSFTFYQHLTSSPDMLLQMLNSQLHSQFHIGGGAMGGASGTGSAASAGQTQYSGFIPTSMYQLLLGACRLGCEPLVFCLLCSPLMDKISGDQLKEAYDCATTNGHETLGEHLMEIHLLHDMYAPHLLSRGDGQTTPNHVPAYYDAIDQLDQGGDSAKERADTVLKHVLHAIKEFKKDQGHHHEYSQEEQDKLIDDITPTVEVIASLSITEASPQRDQPQEEEEREGVAHEESNNDLTPVDTSVGIKRRLSSGSKLKRQTHSISDDSDHPNTVDLHSPTNSTSTEVSSTSLKLPASPSRRESADEVSDLVPRYTQFKKLPINQVSGDSAIGMSFDEDGDSCRRSSLLTDISLTGSNTVEGRTITLTRQAGMEVANSLDWETSVVVMNDFPPNNDKKMFFKGDQIVQVGDHIIRNPDPKTFSELLQNEITAGNSVISVLPLSGGSGTHDRNAATGSNEKLLLRSYSDQSLFSIPSSRINQLLNNKPNNQERTVVIPYTGGLSGCGFKLIGGKTVGLFMTDIRPELASQVTQGDQLLYINGRNTTDLTLYDANYILNNIETTDLQLTVMENKTKFSIIRDQVELDSFYLRSLIDHTPSNTRDMPLKKGTLLRVVNTFCSPNYWLAWSVNEKSGFENQLKRIPTPQGGYKQYKAPIYQRITKSEGQYKRPICILGSDSLVTSLISTNNTLYKRCLNIEDILYTYAQGTVHGIINITDIETISLLTGLHPIVLQVSAPEKATLKEQLHLSKLNSNVTLINGTSTSVQTKQASEQINIIQGLPVWKPLETIIN